jgi:hypothetical protein
MRICSVEMCRSMRKTPNLNRQLWRCGQKTNESECLNRNYRSYEVISMNYGMICRSLKKSLSEKDRLKVRGSRLKGKSRVLGKK